MQSLNVETVEHSNSAVYAFIVQRLLILSSYHNMVLDRMYFVYKCLTCILLNL